MIPDFLWRQGDVEPTFSDELHYTDGTAVDLTAATLGLIMRSLASPAPLSLDGEVDSTDRVNGKIQWQPSAVDTAAIAPGIYLGNWLVEFAGLLPQTFPTDGFLWITVEESLEDAKLSIGSRPPVRQVAGLLRARTRQMNGGGALEGDFVDGVTRPGGTEVEGLIDDAEDEVLGKVVGVDSTLAPGSGYNAPGSRYERRVRSTIALYTAILIEASYYPEQVKNGQGQSVAALYQTLYSSRIKSLISEDKTGQPEGLGDSGSGGGGSDSPADAAWAFPADAGGLVGWQTSW